MATFLSEIGGACCTQYFLRHKVSTFDSCFPFFYLMLSRRLCILFLPVKKIIFCIIEESLSSIFSKSPFKESQHQTICSELFWFLFHPYVIPFGPSDVILTPKRFKMKPELSLWVGSRKMELADLNFYLTLA